MAFKLSDNSLKKIVGIDGRLADVVKSAIEVTSVDFGVTEGLRTLDRQKQLVAEGKSQTLQSNHLTGNAVDLVAYVDGKVSWDIQQYCEIAHAIRAAAIKHEVPIRWGAAWQITDIRKWPGSMTAAHQQYLDQRKALGKKPFVDSPHFEIGTA